MKSVLGALLGLLAIAAGVVVLSVWGAETVAWVGAAALIAAGVAIVVVSIVRRARGAAVAR